MEDAKPWYMSRTIWAALVMVGATIAGGFGFALDDADTEALADALFQAVAALAGVVAILGRLGATTRIE